METLAKTYIIPARQSQFIQEKILKSAPIREIAIAMDSNSVFTGFFEENPSWYQQFNLRDNRTFRGGQPNVHQDTTDNCRLYVTPMKAMNFQGNIASFPNDKCKDHYVLVFYLISIQDATEHSHYPEKFGEPLRLELYFSSPLENVTEFIVTGERLLSVAVGKLGVMGKKYLRWITLTLNKLLTVYLCSSIGISDHLPQTLFQTFQMTRLRLSTQSPATRHVSIG